MSISNIGSGYSAQYTASAYNSQAEEAGQTAEAEFGGGSFIEDTFDSQSSNSEVENLRAQRDQAQSELGELHSQAGEAKNQVLSRKDEIIRQNRTEEPDGKQQAEYEEAKAELNEAVQAKETAQQELEQVSQEITSNGQELSAKQQQQQSVSQELTSAQAELASLTPPSPPSGDDPEAQAAYQAELNAFNARKQELENRVNSLQQQQQQLQNEAMQLQQQQQSLASRYAQAQADMDQQSAVIENAQNTIAEMQQSMTEGSPELQNAMEQDGDLQAMQEEYEQIQQQIADKEAEIGQLDADILAARDISELNQSECAARWANDTTSSDEAKLTEAMEADGLNPEDEDGVIRIGGTDGNDDIDITMGADGSYRVIVNGEESVYSAEEAKRLMVDAGEGDDSIRVHYDEETASFIDAVEQTGGFGNDDVIAKGKLGHDHIEQSADIGDDKLPANGGAGDDRIEQIPGIGDDVVPSDGVSGSSSAGEALPSYMPEGWLPVGSGTSAAEKPQPAVFINGGDGSDVIETDDDFSAQMYVTGGAGDDQITGGSGGSVIIDTQGNNTVAVNGGSNTVITGDGNDNVTANGGSNVIYTQGGIDDITLNEQKPAVLGMNSLMTGSSFSLSENEVHSGGGDDIVTANGGSNSIYGEDGEDAIIAYKGTNSVYGGADDDNITLMDGNNTVFGEDGDDRITAYNGLNYISGGDGDEEVTVYDGSSTVYGNNGNDHIKAYKGDHAFYGEAGNDRIEGGTGREYIEGGYGNDYIDGGEGGDVIYAGYGDDEVRGGGGDDFINAGGGDDIVHGDDGKDIIFGLSGDDELYGDGDEDTIVAGDGNDKVDGGEAADIIRYTDSEEHGHDTVLNADPSDDAKALDPIKVPDNFKVSNTMTMAFGMSAFEMPLPGSQSVAFENLINDNLEAFAAIEPGQALLNGIADTEKTVTFEYFSMPNGTCEPLDKDQNHYEIEENPEGTTYTEGDGSNSKVQINPSFIEFGALYEGAQFREQNTMLVMAHELCHAYNNATGTIDNQFYNNYTGELVGAGDPDAVLGAELQAVGLFDDSVISANPYGMTENDFREYFHMNPRDTYLPPKQDVQ